ncbi:hypothetical protein CGH58_21630 [Vibrio parahaemolyticus]|nr:hypothetical protein CGH58_21630 [Vibrio parahaemolyticus]
MICVKCNAYIKDGRLIKHSNIKFLNCGASYIHKRMLLNKKSVLIWYLAIFLSSVSYPFAREFLVELFPSVSEIVQSMLYFGVILIPLDRFRPKYKFDYVLIEN